MSFYMQMHQQIIQSRKRVRPHKGKTPAQPNGAVAASRRVRAFDAISYRVPGIVPPLRQPSSMTCWATVTTMMLSWKENQSFAIPTALGMVGQTYVDMFNANQGLASAEKGPFLAAVGLQAEPPMSYTAEGWLQLLRTYGPLWVTTDEDPSTRFAIHARIMMGVAGDGTPSGTLFQLVDPATGSEYQENLATFERKYLEEAYDPRRPLRIQVVHWPANAQVAAQSLQPFYTARSAARPRAFNALLAWGAKVSPAFRDRVRQICTGLGCNPDHLMAAIAFETGETFSPSIHNPSSGATGLIQFMPRTAQSLGTTTSALAQMTAEQQLDYVERYFAPYQGRLATLEDVYMAILWPRAVGQANNSVLFAQGTRAYEQNRGLDRNQDGNITKEEAASVVAAKLVKGQQSQNKG